METFDGSSVYRGRKPGLDLHYASLGDGHDEPLGIVSFGEVQPGRYAAAFEAVLWPDSSSGN
ncbi:hypothetical protein C479_10455 [Halovivax asiaticus JCM 14624]|uniref:Uncharacterized protein n=1 Tax=Halovivax asiaticus JCM 14624 TaxID=1227490 RepID=M0BEG5_9EURY|nr:hypothetical protein C479_10455 [Halovivax asiaticus JCM 14624]